MKILRTEKNIKENQQIQVILISTSDLNRTITRTGLKQN